MASLSLSSTSARPFSLHRSTTGCSVVSATASQLRLFQAKKLLGVSSCSLRYNPLRVPISTDVSITGNESTPMKKKTITKRMSTVCYAAPLSVHSIQWIAAVSTVVLLFARGTAVQKSFLVPLFVVQAPGNLISWMKSEYGIWAAFLALLVRLFFFMPGELELPLVALLLVIVAPYQVMRARGRQEGAIISLAIVAYVAYQHFSHTGSLNQSFDRGSIVATLAIICIAIMSCFLLF